MPSSNTLKLMTVDHTESALRLFLDQPDAVIFVGSGLSLWSGLPTWEALLKKLIEIAEEKNRPTQLAREGLANRQLLEAADALQLTRLEIANAMRGPLGFSSAAPSEAHSLLVRLGPKRFVTTNYDSLIEQQLGLDGSLGQFRTVTSRQTAELADIVKASSDAFIFKPHGDLSDAESIVLATRHYDEIISGETNTIRRTLETLLVTRPILFLGYSLRDPDTSLVLRTLRERYLGNIGHFAAVIPDATEEHKTHFWDRYRIQIYSYATKSIGGTRDHGEFLPLLRNLASNEPEKSIALHELSTIEVSSSVNLSVALLRYAARLIQPQPGLEFPLKVHVDDEWLGHKDHPPEIQRFAQSDLVSVLEHCPGSFALVGPAGAGKSFAISNFLSRSGRRIVEWDGEATGLVGPLVPILLDARLYDGSFSQLASTSVPADLDLTELSRCHAILVIVDSLDEMPNQHLESGQWRNDLATFKSKIRNSRVVFGTRRFDLIGQIDLPAFYVMPLTDEVASESLSEMDVDYWSLSEEFRQALSIPFMLALGRRFLGRHRRIRTAPRLLSMFVDECGSAAVEKGGHQELRDKMEQLASSLIESGRETITIADAAAALAGRNRVDRLVSAGLMSSEIDAHIRFVHRTVTEFLAAGNVISLWKKSQLDLLEKLSHRRWDNSVAWAIDSLDPDDSAEFLEGVYAADPVLAYRIVATAEVGATRLWLVFLNALAKSPPDERTLWNLGHSNREAEAPEEAKVLLERLITLRGPIGGWAFSLYSRHASDQELCEWIDRLARGEVDFNHSNLSGPALGKALSGRLA